MFRRPVTLVLALAALLLRWRCRRPRPRRRRPSCRRSRASPPMRTAVGAKLTIRGKNFKARKSRNTVDLPRQQRPLRVREAELGEQRSSSCGCRRALKKIVGGEVAPASSSACWPASSASSPEAACRRWSSARARASTGSGGCRPRRLSLRRRRQGRRPAAGQTRALGSALDPCSRTPTATAWTTAGSTASAGPQPHAPCPTRASGPSRTRSTPATRNIDYDGDSLTVARGVPAWRHTGSQFDPRVAATSTGTPRSATATARRRAARPRPRLPGLPVASYGLPSTRPRTRAVDDDGDGVWTDDERDADADGLNNYDRDSTARRQRGFGGRQLARRGPAPEPASTRPDSYFGVLHAAPVRRR